VRTEQVRRLLGVGGIVVGVVLLASYGFAQDGTDGGESPFTVRQLIDQLQGFVWPLGVALFVGLVASFYEFGMLMTESGNSKPLVSFRFARGNPEEVDKIVRARANKGAMGRLLAILYAMGIRGDLNFHAEVDLITKVREERFASFRSWMIFLSDSAGAFGLLGTVWGMYQVFYTTGGVLDTQSTLLGMGTALVTTLVGIGISVMLNLFSTTMESIFRRQLEQMCNKADDLRFHFVNHAQAKRTTPKAEESAK
jgi:hypothetical protein